MSGYQRINFKDQNVERPKTYDVTNNPDGSITLIESFGNVEELGTPINQENMNHLEDGIDAVSFSKFSLDLTYKKDDLVTDIQDDELKIFKSLKDNNFGNLPSESDYWEEVEIAGGKGSGFNLFDTKIADHILEGEQAKGWALQGTYVSGALYPDFYNECLTQKNIAVETEVTLGDSAITIFKHNNGHQFYNIADKSIVDTFYNTFGIADFYGIDEENERIFLPRNKYFYQLTDDPSKVNEMLEAGLPPITASAQLYMRSENETGAFTGSGSGYNQAGSTGMGHRTLSFDASKSNPIYGNSNTVQPPSSLKLLYYCVGNTVVNDAEIDAGALVAQMEQKANIFLDNTLPSQDFKTQSISWGMPDYTAGVSITLPYTATKDGFVYIRADHTTNNTDGNAVYHINNSEIARYAWYYGNTGTCSGIVPISGGDLLEMVTSTNINGTNYIFFPLKGAK